MRFHSGKHLMLCGFMGAGKSSLGKQLAEFLQLPFSDLDTFIEQQQGRSITSIFSEEGEQFFRNVERTALHNLLSMERRVIALGGGTPCRKDNLDDILASGTLIFLDVSAAELSKRLDKTENRPMLKNFSGKGLEQHIAQLMLERQPFYRQAQMVISGDHIAIDDIVKKLEANE